MLVLRWRCARRALFENTSAFHRRLFYWFFLKEISGRIFNLELLYSSRAAEEDFGSRIYIFMRDIKNTCFEHFDAIAHSNVGCWKVNGSARFSSKLCGDVELIYYCLTRNFNIHLPPNDFEETPLLWITLYLRNTLNLTSLYLHKTFVNISIFHGIISQYVGNLNTKYQ